MAASTTLVVVVTAVYVALMLALGYIGYKKTKSTEDYLVAGRNVHPVVIALSYGATFISTSAIVGFGGQAANLGMGLIWLTVLNIGIGILLAFVVFGKKTREIGQRLKAVTFPDLMGKIYKSPFMQVFTGIIILIGMPLYTAAVLIGGAQFIRETLGISYGVSLIGFAVIVAIYVIFGGLIAVMYTDAVQGAIMLVGMTILLVATYLILGGVTTANTALTNMADLVPQKLAEQGMNGWTVMPDLGSPIWFTVITTLVLGVGIGVLAQPQLVVRFMTAKDNRSLNRAVLVGGPFILMMTGVAFTVGALTNVYFYQTSGKIAVQMATGGNIDTIIPIFINSAMPEWFVVPLHGHPARSSDVNTLIALSCHGYRPYLRCLGQGKGVFPLSPFKPDWHSPYDSGKRDCGIPYAGEYHRNCDRDVHGPLCIGIPAGFCRGSVL